MCFARGGHGGGHCGCHSSGHCISTISSKSNIGIRNSSRINSNTSLANSRGSRDTYFDNINRNSIAFQLISHIFSLIPILFFIFMCAPNEFYEKFIQYKRNRINILKSWKKAVRDCFYPQNPVNCIMIQRMERKRWHITERKKEKLRSIPIRPN